MWVGEDVENPGMRPLVWRAHIADHITIAIAEVEGRDRAQHASAPADLGQEQDRRGTSEGLFPVSAVVCVDNDDADLVAPVSRAGGILAVPANDWAEIVKMHHRSTVWSAVRAGVPLVRSAGHGISAVYDASGRVIAEANSLDGPVSLVADVNVDRSLRDAGPVPVVT